MGSIQLPDELQRVIERQVAEGRAVSPAALVEEAIMRLVDDAQAEQAEISAAAKAGIADAAVGRYTTVASPDDERHLHEGMMARLRARLATGE